MRDVFLKNFFSAALGFIFFVICIPQLSADEDGLDTSSVIDMVKGDVQSFPVNGLNRVSVTNPEVADISDAQAGKVSVVAKKPGATILYLWDASGKHSIELRVVSQDLSEVKAHVQKLLNEANITGVTLEENIDEGKVVLEGALSKDDKARADDILGRYSDSLLNLVKVEKIEDLVQVDMQVIEISTTLEENLGIQWSNAAASSTTSSTAVSTTGGSSGTSGLTLPYTETPPTTNGKIGDFFKIGNFNRNFQLQATVNALLQEGKAKLISKPRLVVISGKQASFLVGGEIPLQNTTTSASGGTTSSSTTYSQYGVNMTVTPTIRDGKIEVVLNVDIRDVDNSSSFSTNTNVAFITRTASTDLLMDDRQTLALAGLIKYSTAETLTQVPILSKIPILGSLFRSRSIPGDSNTEMVIILTPTVLTNRVIADKQLVMPTPAQSEAFKQFDAKYEHEPLPTWPVLPVAAPVVVSHNQRGMGPALAAYARMVQMKISQDISYPQEARDEGSTGTVKLMLRILRDGSLESAEVEQSSGSDILDQDALRAAKAAAPYDAFTMGMDQGDLAFTIPIVYDRSISGAEAPSERDIAL